MNALIPVLCAIVGCLLYALSNNGKVAEIGRLMFMGAFIALMFMLSSHSVRLF